MKADTPVSPKDQLGKEGIPLEVINNEKQLLASIFTKGILHRDVQELFHKVRAGYENVILHSYDAVELQEVEYFLWKLHYKHIDEFRRKIKQCSINVGRRKEETVKDDVDAHNSSNMHMEGFKSFLSEAIIFYKHLLEVFMNQSYLPGELEIESAKMNKCRFTCHRFLICLGDLARYNELCKKQDAQNWSVAFSYYLEAAAICPESGNPHNQMALLATYVGDAFLALYHCIRSLAVKDPFPDAWNNLMLLFEENMSCHLHSFPSCDISNSSEIEPLWPTSNAGSHSSTSNDLVANKCPGVSELWPLFVRLISFFLAKCSLEDFPSTLSSTIKCLEAVMQLDDAQLDAALESYESMGSSQKGPYRVLHMVSVLIFILDSLTTDIKMQNPNRELSQLQLCELTKSALVAAFALISPLLERCFKNNESESFPLLPAVLVFVEWLVGAFAKVECYSFDEKVIQAMSCFFVTLADFLNKLDHSECETACVTTALWEDHDLRGFEPTARAQACLDFTTHQEWNNDNNSRSSSRRQRFFLAGLELMNWSNGNKHKWILYDNRFKKFYTTWSEEVLGHREVGTSDTLIEVESLKLHEEDSPEEYLIQHPEKCKSVTAEEDEVILFNPLMRHGSAPLRKYVVPIDQISAGTTKEEGGPTDECLRRATSMFSGPKQAHLDGPPGFLSGAVISRHNKPLKQLEVSLKDMATCPAGPPSLSAWVFDTETSSIEQDRGLHDSNKRSLSRVAEMASESLADLSINKSKESVVHSGHVSTPINFPPTYVAPVPSAPLLPEDAFWYQDKSSFTKEKNAAGTREADGILGSAPTNGYANLPPVHGLTDFGPILPGPISGYPPLVGMSSSEWLYHYRNNNKPEQASSPMLPAYLNGSETISTSNPNYVSRFDLLNPWGNHLVSTPMLYMESPQLLPGSLLSYTVDGQRRSNLQLGYQNQYPYAYGGATGTRPEQPPLLYYLKEWQLQKDPQLRGAAFMGN